jgi:hypothetical protein
MPTVGERLVRDFNHHFGDCIGSLFFILMRLIEIGPK